MFQSTHTPTLTTAITGIVVLLLGIALATVSCNLAIEPESPITKAIPSPKFWIICSAILTATGTITLAFARHMHRKNKSHYPHQPTHQASTDE